MAEKRREDHRKRLRERFLAGEVESLSDGMLLELLLTFAVGRKDVKPVVQELIRVFGSLSLVLSATPDDLSKVKGIGQASITLLKIVDFIKSKSISVEIGLSVTKDGDASQLQLFEDSSKKQTSELSFMDPRTGKQEKYKKSSDKAEQTKVESESPHVTGMSDSSIELQGPSQASKKSSSEKKSLRRKMQISNGHYLNFNQLARLIYAVSSIKKLSKIKMVDLEEETGLPFRQVRNRISIGRALGLFKQNSLQLTTLGKLVSTHDPFCESRATLEYLHYKASGNFVNLIWYEVFNKLLVHENVMNYKGWMEYFQKALSGQYTENSLKDHLGKELRFIIDAYIEQNFKKLLLLHQNESGDLYLRRYTDFAPLVLSAMIYDFCASREAHLFQVGEMAVTPGSPAVVFGHDAATFRQQIEGLHDRGWLRYETTHNLDQIRLKPGFSALEFLSAHFEDRKPRQNDELGMMNDE